MGTTIYTDDRSTDVLDGAMHGRHRFSFAALGGRVIGALLRWQDRASQRYRLGELNAYLLRDIGLNRSDVTQEARKPFWLD